ncbi:protein kinase domain-containing protein [Nocardia nepalensis]|uniref:serine/threonine-protein kinase n=1 Tax=Nocardia nepalensis TaxID=3375448 RepID=UPI003B685528
MLQSGEVFAGYAIERLLGQGGMGAVYLARHPRLPRLLALKLLNRELFSDNEIRARFEREADLVAQLDHPNIVTVFDRGIENGQLWISMQYVDGVDASSVPAATLPPERAVQIIAETAKALDFAHGKGVLHRDVKPANILLARATGQERVLLTDFGIARPRDDSRHLTQTGSFTATLAFAAPEQLTGAPLDHRSDQYSLACSLYSLLTGVAPFESPMAAAVIQGHLQQLPPIVSQVRPGLPPGLDAVVVRALAKRREDRFDSCAEFAAAAGQALSGSGQFATVATPTYVAPRPAPQQAMPPQGQPQYAVPQAVPQYAVPQPHRPAPGMVGGPYRRHPIPPRRSRTGRVLAICLGVVVTLVLGAGIFVWRDDSTWVAQILGRSKGDKDIHAMIEAFPRMLPSSADGGNGYDDTSCKPTPQWYDFYARKGDAKAFDHWRARWECLLDKGEFAFRIYAYPNAADAQAVIRTLQRSAHPVGTDQTGTRTDYKFLTKDEYNTDVDEIVSSFSDSQRARFVLRSGYQLNRGMDKIAAWLKTAPLN